MTTLKIIGYPLFVGNAQQDGPHMSLSMTEQFEKLALNIRLARSQVGSSKALPLFIAPEWYFSRSERNYLPSELGQIFGKLLTLSKQVPEMLLIPGSIAWSLPFNLDTTPPPPKKKSWSPFRSKKTPEPQISGPVDLEMNPVKKDGEVVYNTVLVAHGGDIVHIYHKRVEGGEIKEKDRGKKFGFQFAIPGFGTMDKFSNTGIFNHEGVRFGLEVCADHKQGTLLNKDLGLPENPSIEGVNQAGVDVQIIVACGSAIANGRVATQVGGHVILVDSSGPKGSFFATKVTARKQGMAEGKFIHQFDPPLTMKSSEFIPLHCSLLDDTDPNERLVALKSTIEV
jgi:hypothetical protein